MNYATPPSRVAYPRNSGHSYLDRVWRFFISVRVALVLLIVIATASLLGVLLPQAPSGLAAHPDAFQQWLEGLRGRYGPLTEVYRALGLFNVFETLWFWTSLVLLSASILLCTLNRLPRLWRSWASPRLRVRDSFYEKAKHRLTLAPPVDVATLASALARQRYRVSQIEEGQAVYLYADRYGWAKLGSLVVHLSMVLILIGALVGRFGGFEMESVIADGATAPVYPVNHPQQIQIKNEGFTAEFYPDGRPKDYYSDIVLFQGGREVKRGRVRVNEPLSYGGMRFHQAFYGPAAGLEIRDGGGRVLFSEMLPLERSFDGVSYQWIGVPGTELQVLVGLVSEHSEGESLALMGYKGQSGEAAFRTRLSPGASQELEGLRFTFTGKGAYTGLFIKKDPGDGLVWAGSALFMLGLIIVLFFPRSRLWAKVTPQGAQIAGVAERFLDLEGELRRMAEEAGLTPGGDGRVIVRLYTKEGCHLCQETKALLHKLEVEFPLKIEEVDVTREEVYNRYRDVIPVVEIQGAKPIISRISEFRLRKALREAGVPGRG